MNKDIMNIEVQLILKNDFGEFFGDKVLVDKESYLKILDMSKSFYKSNGFELTCEDGSFVVFPPEIVRRSILRVVVSITK
jgi:hypothetical protein